MSKFKMRLSLVIAMLLMTSMVSAQIHITSGGRATLTSSDKAEIARVLTQCRAAPVVSFVMHSTC